MPGTALSALHILAHLNQKMILLITDISTLSRETSCAQKLGYFLILCKRIDVLYDLNHNNAVTLVHSFERL